ncbi:hypothetical protein UYO_1894 [Lachnospiraceae bacterium JC7]|nr:hypothetical protein UYO_1894 [Lachnospiraceae bacterium JC7]
MISQRAGDGVNPAEIQFRKWTAKGTMKSRERIMIQRELYCSYVFLHSTGALTDQVFDIFPAEYPVT